VVTRTRLSAVLYERSLPVLFELMLHHAVDLFIGHLMRTTCTL